MTDDEEAKAEIMAMDAEQLSLVDHDKYKLECSVEGCKKFWHVKDYGCTPHYLIRRRWYDLTSDYMCDVHFKSSKPKVYKRGTTIQRLIKV